MPEFPKTNCVVLYGWKMNKIQQCALAGMWLASLLRGLILSALSAQKSSDESLVETAEKMRCKTFLSCLGLVGLMWIVIVASSGLLLCCPGWLRIINLVPSFSDYKKIQGAPGKFLTMFMEFYKKKLLGGSNNFNQKCSKIFQCNFCNQWSIGFLLKTF